MCADAQTPDRPRREEITDQHRRCDRHPETAQLQSHYQRPDRNDEKSVGCKGRQRERLAALQLPKRKKERIKSAHQDNGCPREGPNKKIIQT